MKRTNLVLRAASFGLVILLSGCGSSSHSPSSPLSITTSTLPQGVVNVSYAAALSATGGLTPYAWNVASGSLPPGLSLSRAGVLSGTPTASGGYSFSVAVADSEQPVSVANGNFSITIAPALQVSTTSLPVGSPSVFYSATLAAAGGLPPYSWTIAQGSLPNGLTLNATSGVISGTPTGAGTSTFTVQTSDTETPAATAAANLSIGIIPPAPRNAGLYIDQAKGPAGFQSDQTGLQIQSDGSLTLLPSSPESAITGVLFGSSPTLPLLFFIENLNGAPSSIKSLLVNPDYSLASYGSAPLQGGVSQYSRPVVDPTGSNLYLPGPIDSNLTPGVTIYPANGSLQSLGTLAIPNISNLSQIVFTPDGTLAFISTCSSPNQGSILSYSRSSDGALTPGLVSALPAGSCGATVLTVSPDGRYLAESEAAGMVQIYTIASDGTLTAVLPQPFTVTADSQGDPTSAVDMTWDQSSAFLLVSTSAQPHSGPPIPDGGVAVLSFVGNTLTETAFPTGGPATGRILRVGSRVYAMEECHSLGCGGPYGILGFDFQNGQLLPLPGSPYQYGNGSDMVIY